MNAPVRYEILDYDSMSHDYHVLACLAILHVHPR